MFEKLKKCVRKGHLYLFILHQKDRQNLSMVAFLL